MHSIFYITLSLFILNTCFAQTDNRTYYTQENKETKDSTTAYYYREIQGYVTVIDPVTVIEKYIANDKTKLFGTYNNIIDKKYIGQKLQAYETGKIKSKESFSQDGIRIDTAQYYHPNGKLKTAYHYPYKIIDDKTVVTDTLILIYRDSLGKTHLVNGEGYAEIYIDNNNGDNEFNQLEKGSFKNHKRTGEWSRTFQKGKYKFIETYENGKLISGITTDSLNIQTTYNENNYMKEPDYPHGGILGFRKFIANNYNYPQESINAGINGEVRVSFIVEKNGEISNIKIEKDLGYNTGKEAVKVVKRSKTWNPGIMRGVPVRVNYMLPIKLNLSNR